MKKITVWLRLPDLPIELWSTRRLLGIVEEAGNIISIDDFTNQLNKTYFARVQVEINATLPLKPRVLIKGENRVF